MDDVRSATTRAAASAIPLDLAPLLSPYRRHGHLSLRVERLPIQARLSRGSNNGDRTWSLTLDDLQDLAYLPPEGMAEAHTLTVRIVSLEGDYGATLALHELPISPGKVPAGVALEQPAAPRNETEPAGDGGLDTLRRALATANASLGARESELTALRHELDRIRSEAAGQTIETATAAARAAWDVEHKEVLAQLSAEAATTLEKSRAAWQAEHDARIAKLTARVEERIEEARGRWKQETVAALAKAEASWKADEAARLAANETQWRETSARALAESEARHHQAEAALVTARAQGEAAEAERRRLRDELVARAKEGVEEARKRWQQEAATALTQAEAAWKTGEAARFAATEAQWKETSARARTESEAQRQRAEAALAVARKQAVADDAEKRRLHDALAEVKASLAAAEIERGEMQATLERTRSEAPRQEAGLDLSSAQAVWDAELRQRLAEAAAEAAAALEKSHAAWRSEERQRFAEAEQRAEQRLEQARRDWQHETEAALAKAEQAWRAEETARRAATTMEGAGDTGAALVEARRRLDRAEAALAAARTQADGDAVELHFLREELAEVKASLTARETELAEAHGSQEQAHWHWRGDRGLTAGPAVEVSQLQIAERLLTGRAREDALMAEVGGVPRQAAARRPQGRIVRRFLRLGALAAVLVVAGIYYPRIEHIVLDLWWHDVAPLFATETAPPRDNANAEARQSATPPTQLGAWRTVVSVSIANVRTGPSAADAVITTLARNTPVTPVERRGNWVLVRIGSGDATHPQEGWVYSSSLKTASDP